MMNDIHDAQRLKELQALPLDKKIQISQARIAEWYYHFNGNVYISFSGGKDSTVLLDIARQCFPDIPAVFVNTGLEYPEIVKFAKSFDNVTEVRPVWGSVGSKYGHKSTEVFTFLDVLKIYGYPLIGKEVSDNIYYARTNPNSRYAQKVNGLIVSDNGEKSMYNCLKYKPLVDLPFKIGASCCKAMKKRPSKHYEKDTGRKPITGQQADESRLRRTQWLKTGCNAFDSKKQISNPLSFWTEQDILRYIQQREIEIAPVYGDVVSCDDDGNEYASCFLDIPLKCTGCTRTGCTFCAYGFHLEKGETRFQRLKHTHPRLYEYSIGGGEWVANPNYSETAAPGVWNPKTIWMPNKKGLGMGKVFDMCNDIYGKNFMRYE